MLAYLHKYKTELFFKTFLGSGKTELIKKFAKSLDYNIQTVYLYKDMSARDLIQQRITLNNGDTKWQNSSLVEAALNGDLLVLGKIFLYYRIINTMT